MTNIYSSLVAVESNDGFEDYLRRIHIIDIFKDVFVAFPIHALKIIKFIVYAYSVESELLYVQGGTWNKMSKTICEKVGFDDEVLNVDMLLDNEHVRASINKWLQFQSDDNFVQYVTFRDLRRQYLEAALFPLPKYKSLNASTDVNVDGNSDAYARMKNMIDAKMNAAKFANELLDMMREALNKFVQKHPKLKESISALDTSVSKRQTASVEDFLK